MNTYVIQLFAYLSLVASAIGLLYLAFIWGQFLLEYLAIKRSATAEGAVGTRESLYSKLVAAKSVSIEMESDVALMSEQISELIREVQDQLPKAPSRGARAKTG